MKLRFGSLLVVGLIVFLIIIVCFISREFITYTVETGSPCGLRRVRSADDLQMSEKGTILFFAFCVSIQNPFPLPKCFNFVG